MKQDRLSLCQCWLVTLLIVTGTMSSFAQDNQYWTQQYGAKSTLMAGAVVGGCSDNTAVYYNPARLAFLSEASISIHADLFKFQQTSLQNVAGTGNTLNSPSYYTYPTAITGLIDFKNKHWKAGYMFMMRQNSEFKFSYDKEIDMDNLFTNYNGSYSYIGGFSRKSKLEDIGAGMSIAYQFNDHFSIGITQFFNYRNVSYNFNSYGRAVGDTTLVNLVASNTETHDIVYSNFRTYSKIGIAYQAGLFKMGVTATLPSVNLGGRGDITREQLWTNDFANDPNSYPSLVSYDKQEKLKTTYQTPLSIGLGLEYHSEKTILALAGEWFGKINEYNIMSPIVRTPVLPKKESSFIDVAYMTVYAHNNSVINFAVAWQQQLSEKFILHAGFATDLNYAKNDRFQNYSTVSDTIGKMIINQSSWDIFHHTLGFSYKKKHSMITFGADYQTGSASNQQQWTNLNNPDPGNALFGKQLNNNNIHYSSLNFVIGFTHFIHHEVEKEPHKE